MKTEEELELELEIEFGDGRIAAIPEAPVIAEIRRLFPFVGSKISWQQALSHTSRKFTTIDDAVAFFLECVEGVPDMTRCVLIGNPMFSSAYTMSLNDLKRVLDVFLNHPADFWIVDEPVSWCFVSTLYWNDFGFADLSNTSDL